MDNQDIETVSDIYTVPLTGGTPVKLSGPFASSGLSMRNVDTFEFSRDGRHIVYLADQQTPGVNDLYSVPVSGGAAVKLNDARAGEPYEIHYQISSDGQWVVYHVQPSGPGQGEIYRANIDGGEPIMLSQASGKIVSFALSGPQNQLVYLEESSGGAATVSSVPLSGGMPSEISRGLEEGERILYYLASSSGGVVALASLSGPSGGSVYLVPSSGGTAQKVISDVDTGGRFYALFSPDGHALAYRADQDTSGLEDYIIDALMP